MDQANQGEGSGVQSAYPEKRKRGRPRKDPSVMAAGAVPVPPGFEKGRQRADRTGETNSLVGRTVTGVVEAAFDDGFLICIRVGDSPIDFRGVVFKPGHFVPVTPENDIAPHLPMIRRHNVGPPAGNQGPQQFSQALVVQTAGKVPPKHKRESPRTPRPVHPVGERGTVVPVVLQPANFLNGPNPEASDLTQSSMVAFGDKDVHTVEPLAMLPPGHSIPASSIFHGPKPHTGSEQTDKKTVNEGTSTAGLGEKNMKPMESTDPGNSSGISDTQMGNDKEASKSSAEKSGGVVPKQETGNDNNPVSTEFFPAPSVPKAMFNFGAGRMTQLLQAVQENLKERREPGGEHRQVEFQAK